MKRVNTATWSETEGRWTIKVQKNGVRKTFHSSTPGRKGKTECNEKADEWLETGVSSSRMTVAEVWEQFIEYKAGISSASNVKRLNDDWGNYIGPLLGRMKISEVQESDYQSVIDKSFRHKTFKKGAKKSKDSTTQLSKKTLMNIASTMGMMAKYARKVLKVSTVNPEFEYPKAARVQTKTILSPEAVRTLFAVSTTDFHKRKGVEDEYINAYRLQVVTGMRPGELIGLQCGDISFVDGVPTEIQVRRAVNVHGEVTTGKNENAVRNIPVTGIAASVLCAQKKLLESKKAPAGNGDSFFRISSQASYYGRWKRYQIVNQIQGDMVSPYEMRHTFVSMCKYLPEWMVKPVVGHSKAMDTFGVYAHTLSGDSQLITAAIDDILRKITE